jgi:hypothetical protein
MRLFIACALLAASPLAAAQQPLPGQGPIRQVLVHPLFKDPYLCSEHAAGELPHPGDALGQDCMVAAFDDAQPVQFQRLYRTDGRANQDWYGWDKPVHAPCDCEVVQVHVNPVTNLPGQPAQSRASGVVLKRDDGILIALGHLQGLTVKTGDTVKAGAVVGAVGNNGYARAPHVHIGAWQGKQALQIRWDQRAMQVR